MSITTNLNVILSDDEKNQIINLFPPKLRSFLDTCNNPLDETQILINLFKDKNVRIILCKEIDDFDDEEIVAHFHCGDIADNVNFDKKHIDRWVNLWKIELKYYKNLVHQNWGAINCDKRTDQNALFISEQELKKVLIKINTDEAKIFKDWILRQATLTKKIIKHIITVKHQLELQKRDEENNKLKIELKETKEQMPKRIAESIELFRQPERTKGFVYTASSVAKLKLYMQKIGYAEDSNRREKELQTSNPDIQILHKVESKDAPLVERFIHRFLSHHHVNKEFYFVNSIERSTELLNDFTEFINKMIDKYDNDYYKLRTAYINNNKQINLLENIKTQYKSSNKKLLIQQPKIIDPYDIFIKKFIIIDKHSCIKCTDLIKFFKNWLINEYNNNETSKNIKQTFINKIFKVAPESRRWNGVSIHSWKGYKLVIQ